VSQSANAWHPTDDPPVAPSFEFGRFGRMAERCQSDDGELGRIPPDSCLQLRASGPETQPSQDCRRPAISGSEDSKLAMGRAAYHFGCRGVIAFFEDRSARPSLYQSSAGAARFLFSFVSMGMPRLRWRAGRHRLHQRAQLPNPASCATMILGLGKLQVILEPLEARWRNGTRVAKISARKSFGC